MQDFRKLVVWRRGHELALKAYALTAAFPREEVYGLTSQIRRSAASIPANIAEGCGRGGNAELARFLRIAMGSASELEYHLQLAHDLAFLSTPDHHSASKDVTEIKRMLTGLEHRVMPGGKKLTTED
jgi:four helix bundle protein